MKSRRSKHLLRRFGLWFMVALICFYMLFPVWWTIISSLKSQAQLQMMPATMLPRNPVTGAIQFYFKNYLHVITDPAFLRGLFNSCIVAGSSTLIALCIGAFSGFAIGKLRFKGKTHFVKGLIENLKTLGKKTDPISKTHTASQRIKGVTADHYIRRHVLHGISTADCVWVDEFGQIEHSIWCELNKLENQWILSGDENQFLPIWSSYRGVEIDEHRLHKSRFLHQLCGGNRLVLTECMRSERELFDYYSSLIYGGSRFIILLEDVLTEARRLFHFDGPARHNLVISHRKRIQINKELNLLHKPDDATFIKTKPLQGQLCKAQDMWIWPGLEVLGCTQASKKVKNNVLYTVKAVGDNTIEIEKEADTISLTHEQFGILCRLSFARTYASIQGTEFGDESLRLHDTTNKNFSHKHLFVAISRSSRGDLIDVV